AVTDPARVKRTDPGTPEICNIFTLHRQFSSQEVVGWAAQGCRTAGIGCIDCKKKLHEGIVAELLPIRERAEKLAAKPDEVREILRKGGLRAREVAQATMEEVRRRIGVRR